MSLGWGFLSPWVLAMWCSIAGGPRPQPQRTLRRKWRNKCAGHRSFPVNEQFSAPPQKLLQAHKVVLNSPSPFNKNTHPLIFLRGSTHNWKCENTAERSHINAINVTLQRFLFCVFAELVISKMLFHSECFVTQWARNIFFNVDIPVMLSECFLGLELFATHITNKITNHDCEFWFGIWSYSGECLSLTDSKAVSWNFHFYDDQSNPLNARLLIEIVFFFGISEVWKGS